MDIFKILGTIGVNNSAANAAIDQTTQKAQTGASKMGKAFKTLATGLFTAYSVTRVVQFGKACVDAYNVQASAELKLETIMRQRMKSTDKQIQQIKEYTGELQQQGVVGDEVQIAGAQQLATFLKSEKALKSLLPAMNNLAVQQNGVNVTSESMISYGNMFGKVMQGQTAALRRVGITFNKAQEQALKYGTEEERAAVLAQVITDNVGNMNEKFAKTDAGKIQQAKNLFGDLQELIGGKLIGTLGSLAGKANTALSYITDNFNRIWSITSKVTKAILAASAAAVTFKTASALASVVKTWNAARVAVLGYNGVVKETTIAKGILNGTLGKEKSIMAILTGQVKISTVAQEAYNKSLIKSRISSLQQTAANLRSAAAAKTKAAADMIATSRVWALVAAHRAAMIATLGLAAPIVLLAGYMLKTGASAEETASRITAFADNIANMITAFANNLPTMIDAIMPAITNAIQGVAQALPIMIPALIAAGLQLFMALVNSLDQIIPPLVAALVRVVQALANAMPVLIPALMQAAVVLFMALVKALPKVIMALVATLPKIVSAVKKGLANGLSKVWDSIKNTARTKWNNIKTTMLKPITTARDKIKAIIDKIKGFFNFKVKAPHIPLPHFNISPAGWKIGDLLKGKIPSLGINWHADGGIFDKPTLFGTVNGLHGVGEAGAEAITPISKLQSYVSASVAEQNNALLQGLREIMGSQEYTINVISEVDGKAVANATAKYSQNALNKLQTRNNRLVGVR